MNEYRRKDPSFSLCGLNCSLCPRFHTEGSSKCPGCGGESFSIKHPTCAVVTCNKKHDHVEYCFECSLFPCERYAFSKTADSFITYKNIEQNMAEAKRDLQGYLKELKRKQAMLEDLITNYNDGKSKGFYCLAVNLLPLTALDGVIQAIHASSDLRNMSAKEKAKVVVRLFKEKADEMGIELKLRK
jgi:hypothetical protein